MGKGVSLQSRILAVALSTKGFGYTLLEGGKLIDWGVKSVAGDKNSRCLLKVNDIVKRYDPSVVVLESCASKRPPRSQRIRNLTEQIVEQIKGHRVQVQLFLRDDVRRIFFGEKEKGSKHALAAILAQEFPEELAHRLPSKRRPWMSEHYSMGIFDALGLALAFARRRRSH